MVMNLLNKVRTRTIDIRYKWVAEQAQRGLLRIEYVDGMAMAVDGLTKPLLWEKHNNFVRLLGMAS
jgi:hypothetical protein